MRPRAVAIIDGEHYPPVVRQALASLGAEYRIVAAAFAGGVEKLDAVAGDITYGVPVVTGGDAAEALSGAIERYAPSIVLDLSDEPVLTASDRLALASLALSLGVAYRGADFSFVAPSAIAVTATPTLHVIGTGKRVGKTAVSAFVARYLKDTGRDVVVLAMGRGGPAEPELIRGDQVALTTADLVKLARQGAHAASDNYEDAVMSRVATVGCRRCGGGLAGETFVSNVPAGAELADSLGKEIIIAEGSGSAAPSVLADATLLVVGAGRGTGYVTDFFGPYRIARADAVVVAGAEEPLATGEDVDSLVAAIRGLRADLPVSLVTFRPRPLVDVAGMRVFFATTAPAALLPMLSGYLESEFGCAVVAGSCNLSNRTLLRRDMAEASGTYDVLLTELKAAAVDVVAAYGEETGVPTVLCDNEPIGVGGVALPAVIERLVRQAHERCEARSR